MARAPSAAYTTSLESRVIDIYQRRSQGRSYSISIGGWGKVERKRRENRRAYE